ncbi:TetR/AcrR family transcriptional regulator [Streptomonospora sp. S1-112]|uniref:TetR/AcrR family transcriptional regulator n=1 Tax=Streptomonospora mangrovi TaxID=2883123 RepID=A0A9X3NH67_9ACTN|nr:TetR/AcrR family transcriptional regulator [Streptomonospora mangrovi]MDA0563387.1 TetR/AcrR family transcriptional regulator [Streptomonospora mangrovi]
MPHQTEERRYHHGGLRAALLEAAERSVRDHGVAQLSLRDLAREVGVSHAAPRRHFADRQELLTALAEVGFARLGQDIRGALAETPDEFCARLRGAASAFAHFATGNPALLELMNSTKHHPEAPGVARASDEAFAPILALISEGQQRGLLREGDPQEAGLILFATVNGITTLVNTGLVPAGRLDHLIATAVDLFLRGSAP